MNFEIQASVQGSRETSLSALRNKVRKHALSKAHSQAVKMAEQQKEAVIENAVASITESYMKGNRSCVSNSLPFGQKRTDPFLTMRASLSCKN